MHFQLSWISAIIAFCTLASAGSAGDCRPILRDRDEVAACKAVLVALKASAFCSSFVPIKDVTSTSTASGTQGTPVTVTAACTPNVTRKKRQASTRPPPVSTTQAGASAKKPTPTTTPRVTSGSSKSSSKTTLSTTSAKSSKCTIQGLPPAVAIFACQVIKEACLAYVKPRTVTVTTSKSGNTNVDTVTVTPTCPPTTTSSTTTTSASPSCTASCSDTGISRGLITYNQYFRGCNKNVDTGDQTQITQEVYYDDPSDCEAVSRCATFTNNNGGGAFRVYYFSPTNNWICDAYVENYSGGYVNEPNVAQYYQYNS